MNSDRQYEPVVRLWRTSAPGRVVQAVRSAVARSWSGSTPARVWRGAALLIAAEPPAARVRAAGFCLAAALATLEAGIALMPASTRPTPPGGIAFVAVAAAAVLLAIPSPIARAWPASRVRRTLRSLRAGS